MNQTFEREVVFDSCVIFDFKAGEAGGLAFFLATYITIGIAKVINFFLQRNVTFKSKTNPWIAALWYLLAFVVIV